MHYCFVPLNRWVKIDGARNQWMPKTQRERIAGEIVNCNYKCECGKPANEVLPLARTVAHKECHYSYKQWKRSSFSIDIVRWMERTRKNGWKNIGKFVQQFRISIWIMAELAIDFKSWLVSGGKFSISFMAYANANITIRWFHCLSPFTTQN